MLSIACAALSVQFNVVVGVQRGDWLSVEAHVWMPALALGVWYWLPWGGQGEPLLRITPIRAEDNIPG